MGLTIIIFSLLNNTSAIDAVYKLASYTYGPILGMFAFGILTRREVRDGCVPWVSIAAPLLCLVLQLNSERWFGGYQFKTAYDKWEQQIVITTVIRQFEDKK